MNNALDGYAAVVAENEKLRARIKELEAERDSIEAATARRCAEIVHTGIGYYDDPDYACTDLKNAILREFKLEPK